MPLAVPIVLSVVAGYVDGCTFVGLFGLFVAQVTGSFVVAGAQFVLHDTSATVKILAIPIFFCAAIVTTVVAKFAGRPRGALVASLLIEVLLLTGLVITATVDAPLHDPNQPAALAAAAFGLCAMGVQSALVRLLFKDVGSTNVMTTTTTQIAIDAAETLLAWGSALWARDDAGRREHYVSARRDLLRHLPLPLGFLAGTIAGVLAYSVAGFGCLVAAIAVMLGLIIWVLRRPAP